MKYKILLLIIFTTISLNILEAKVDPNNKEARILVENYFEAIASFCKKYELSYNLFIENSLLEDPNINFPNDLKGHLNKDFQANWYFMDIADQRVTLSYKSDFNIETCKGEDGKTFLGAFVQKTIISSNGEINQYKELIVLKQATNNTWRISSIASELFQDINKYRLDSSKNENRKVGKQVLDTNCNSELNANREYENGNHDIALELYLQAQNCTNNKIFIKNRINDLKSAKNMDLIFDSAETQFKNKDYRKALANYQTIINNGVEQFNSEKITTIGQRVAKCKIEIDLNRLIQNADYYSKKNAFNKALPLYEEALKISPRNPIIENKLIECKSKAQTETKQKQLAKINEGLRLIKKKKYNTGFSILLRLRDTGYLNKEHLFYMAQILDTYPKSIRKEFEITKVDCCVLTKQFMIEARNLGASSEDFDFFWDTHFNDKSRSCIH